MSIRRAVRIRAWCWLLLLVSSISAAAGEQASTASVQKFFEQTGISAQLKGMRSALDQRVKSVLEARRSAQPRSLSPEQRGALKALAADMSVLGKQTLVELETRLIELYRESLTQTDIDSLLAIFRTEAGQEVLRRLLVENQSPAQVLEYLQSLSQSDRAALDAIAGAAGSKPLMEKVSAIGTRSTQLVDEMLAGLRTQLEEKLQQNGLAK